MHQAYLIGATAVLAQAGFSNTINLGAVLVGIMIVFGFAWASRKDKRSERWEALYNLADVERKEIQAKLDGAIEMVTQQQGIITKLDALQMPVKIVELMNSSVERIEAASEARDLRAQERHESSMELMSDLVKAVTALSIKVDEQE